MRNLFQHLLKDTHFDLSSMQKKINQQKDTYLALTHQEQIPNLYNITNCTTYVPTFSSVIAYRNRYSRFNQD
jgi:hypothetical protein